MLDSGIKSNPLISVIIPVYKVEEYLNKCVDSVLNQEFKEIEVLLINDGSPDNCPVICDEYARVDQRVRVVHQKNGGLSVARNTGINVARGVYLMFLDSDDYWDGSGCLHNLVESIAENDAELILYGVQDLDYFTNKRRITRTGYNIEELRLNRDSAIKSLFKKRQFPRAVWTLAIKREFVIKNQLYFEKGLRAEDIDWLVNVFMHATSFDAVNDAFYIYVINRPGAITSTSYANRVKYILYSVRKWMLVLESDRSPVNRLLLSYLANQYIISFLYFARVPRQNRKELLPEIKQYKPILIYAGRGRGYISKILINILGIQTGAAVLLRMYRMSIK
jgi:glycosyltransferase involved in cell wall biosynthesis